MSGKGEAGVNGGPAGDLYVVVHVRNHEFFEREGDHIICEMPLTFAQMALGAEVEVPTVHGKVKLKIPAGTQTGTEFRLKGKGAPNVRGYGQGDQYVVVRVVVPTKLTSQQKIYYVNLQDKKSRMIVYSESLNVLSKGIMEIKMELVNCEMVRN